MSVHNAAETLHAISQLPEYQTTLSSTRVLEDLYLSAKAELKLIMDERTTGADLRVKADTGFVSVTYKMEKILGKHCRAHRIIWSWSNKSFVMEGME